MDLPASVTDLGEKLRARGEITPDPALLHDPDVFAAERERIFTQPSIAVDHEARLSTDRSYFRCDAAPRGLIVTRDTEGRLRALRNICIHAGYPVCEADDGAGERLICLYHGWEYALDGRLVEPAFSSRIDPSRLRLAEYPLEVCNGLILVDLSGKSAAAEQYVETVPAWLATAKVVARTKYSTAWNWKFLNHFLRSSPHLFFGDAPDRYLEFGPLSFMIVQRQRAFLLRVIPRFVEQTDFHVIGMVGEEAFEKNSSASGGDAIADGLRFADTSPGWFDHRFADWYWSLMGPQ
jgi:nitrite reductase/ring-hydroxylating ferredoxin subunit